MAGAVQIGVVRGGISGEYDVSLETGAAVLRNLPKKYRAVDIVIDKYGKWHMGGLEYSPERIFPHVDAAFNALHGFYGEDGKVQQLFEAFGVPYTGSGILGSSLGLNKAHAKAIFKEHNLKTPYAAVVKKGDMAIRGRAAALYRSFPPPAIVKPNDSGSSLGVCIPRDFEKFKEALEDAFEVSDAALVEEFIRGREATCGVIDNFRGDRLYALPPVEIIPPDESAFFNYEVKYNGKTREICPGNFSFDEKKEIMRMATAAHAALGLRHYSRADFIVSPRGIYLLEVNTLPGLTEESLFPKSLAAVGCSMPDFLDHVIARASGPC